MSKNKRIIESWQANAEAWIDSVQNNKIQSRITTTNEAIINTILDFNPNHVLDLGCGEGWLCRELSEKGINTVGIDGSEPLIEEAKQKHHGQYYCQTYEEFINEPLVTEKFDVIVFNFALLAKQIQPLLSTCKNLLTENGVIIIQTVHPFSFGHPYVNHWKEEDYAKMGEGYKMAMPWYFRTISGWVEELNNAHLTLVDLHEPIDYEQLKPQSLIIVCR